MPIVQIEILEGRTLEQKRNMVKEVTESICKNMNCLPERVSIIIREMPKEHLAIAGELAIDKK